MRPQLWPVLAIGLLLANNSLQEHFFRGGLKTLYGALSQAEPARAGTRVVRMAPNKAPAAAARADEERAGLTPLSR